MAKDKGNKLGPYKRAVLEARQRAGDRRIEGDGYVLHQYPDRDTYREVQIAGNKAKLRMQFVKESHIRILADYLSGELGAISFGICHGTRRGAEQRWFRAHLAGEPEVIGTEISDTAGQFPDTVQWDFHEVNPHWSGRADFVYSNSWDHAFEPAAAFAAWFDALRPGGLLLLDYTKGQTPEEASALDPFGVTYDRLLAMLTEQFAGTGRLRDPIDTRKTNKEYRARVVVLEKSC
jgi:hypothetical protein